MSSLGEASPVRLVGASPFKRPLPGLAGRDPRTHKSGHFRPARPRNSEAKAAVDAFAVGRAYLGRTCRRRLFAKRRLRQFHYRAICNSLPRWRSHEIPTGVGGHMSEARVSLSYARADGTDPARALRQHLEAAGLSVWQDLVALQGGRDWWSQIEEALRSKSLEHLVLVLTPQALSRPVIRREIRLARQEGKQVHPVRGPGLDLATVPRWMGHVIDLDIPEQWKRLFLDLKGPSQQSRVPMMAPEPPEDFVARPTEFAALQASLLDERGDAKGGRLTAITAALRGAGGYGKTTLAKALAHDPDIIEAFFDGILWVELGERPPNLLATLLDLIQRMTGERPVLENLDAAASALGEALGDRRVLLVIDDCWREQDLQPFLQGGRSTTRLVTTRLDRILPVDTFKLPVDAMQPVEAVDLLKWGLPPTNLPATLEDLQNLSARLGEWALLLKLINSFLRKRVGCGETLATAIGEANRRLDEKGLTAFESNYELDRTKASARCIEISLELLNEAQRAHFAELAVFPEDVDIPIEVAAALWSKTGCVRALEAEDLLTELYGVSLLLALDFERRTFRLHDTIRKYLREKAGVEKLASLNAEVVAAMEGAEALPVQSYDLRNRPQHLHDAGDRAALDALLTDPAWIEKKVRSGLGGVLEVFSDYRNFSNPDFPLHKWIRDALRTHFASLSRDHRQCMAQLHGRLLFHAESTTFAKSAFNQISSGALYETRAALKPPHHHEFALWSDNRGPIIAALSDKHLAVACDDSVIMVFNTVTEVKVNRHDFDGHYIHSLAGLPDGRLAFNLSGISLCVLDVATGKQVVSFDSELGSFSAWTTLSNGRLAVASDDDQTIRIHYSTKRGEAARFNSGGDVTALVALPDGRLAGALRDNTVRIWDVATGEEKDRFSGHENRVSTLVALPHRRLASASEDGTIRLWDLTRADKVARIIELDSQVTALTVLPNGRLATASSDWCIRIWDPELAIETDRFFGSEALTASLAALPDGRLVSHANQQVYLWDLALANGDPSLCARTLLPLTANSSRASPKDWQMTLAMPSKSYRATVSKDNFVRLWGSPNGVNFRPLIGHTGPVTALAVLPDGRLASASGDKTIRLWDLKTAVETARLQGHEDYVFALAALKNGQLASASGDNTVRLWETSTGRSVRRFKSREKEILQLGSLPNGRLICVFEDKAVFLWRFGVWAETIPLGADGVCEPGFGVMVMRDGRVACLSSNDTIRLWDLDTGAVTAAQIKMRRVTALAQLANGQLVIGSGDSLIRIWDPDKGIETAPLLGHRGQVIALAELADSLLASGSDDNTVRIWDLRSGAESARLTLDAPVLCLAKLPDGRIAAGDLAGNIHLLAIKDADAE